MEKSSKGSGLMDIYQKGVNFVYIKYPLKPPRDMGIPFPPSRKILKMENVYCRPRARLVVLSGYSDSKRVITVAIPRGSSREGQPGASAEVFIMSEKISTSPDEGLMLVLMTR